MRVQIASALPLTTTLSTRLPTDQADAVFRYCQRRGVSVAELLRLLVAEELSKAPSKD